VREVIQLGEQLFQRGAYKTVSQHTVAANWDENNVAFRGGKGGGATFAVYTPAGSAGTESDPSPALFWAKVALFLGANAALLSCTIMLLRQRQQR
jgi:hypothetical protein